jgi:hypothetical protein
MRDLAAEFGTSKSHIQRLVSQASRQELAVIDFGDTTASRTQRTAEIAIEKAGLDPDEDIEAAILLALAEKVDAVRAATSAQSAIAAPGLHRALDEQLARIREAGGDQAPRLGRLQGEQARIVLLAIGYPEPDEIDLDSFDTLDATRLQRERRRGGQPEQPGLEAAGATPHAAAYPRLEDYLAHVTAAATEQWVAIHARGA